MRRSVLLTIAATAACAGLLGLPAAASAQGDWGTECNGVTDCLAVESPWVHLDRSGSSGWALYCTPTSP
jgi:hypothetical protein